MCLEGHLGRATEGVFGRWAERAAAVGLWLLRIGLAAGAGLSARAGALGSPCRCHDAISSLSLCRRLQL